MKLFPQFSLTQRALLCAATLALLSINIASCAAQDATTKSQHSTHFPANRVAVGYLTFNKWDKYGWDDIEYRNLTHLVTAFVVPKSPTDPTIVYKGTDEDFAHYKTLKEPTFAAYLEQLTATAHAQKVRVLLGVNSLTGENAQDLGQIFADDKLRAKFVANLLAYCRAHDVDGVDLDYEYALAPAAGKGVVKFMADMRAAANADARLKDNFLLTMAVGTSAWANKSLDYSSLKQSCDWFNVMTYDYAATWTKNNGFNAPLYADGRAKAHGHNDSVDTAVGYFRDTLRVPTAQIVIGLGFYGQKFDDIDEIYGKNKGGTDLKYRDVVQKYLDKPGWKYGWSADAQVPYLSNSATKSFVTYDDERSIAAKVNYAIEHDLRGVMIWELSRGFLPGASTTQPLLETIGKVLNFTAEK